MLCLFLRLNFVTSHFLGKSENNRIFYENNRHIFQELKNRIMGEKKHNLSGPSTEHSSYTIVFPCYLVHMHSFPRPIPNTLLVGDVRLKYGVSQPHPSHI